MQRPADDAQTRPQATHCTPSIPRLPSTLSIPSNEPLTTDRRPLSLIFASQTRHKHVKQTAKYFSCVKTPAFTGFFHAFDTKPRFHFASQIIFCDANP